MRIVNGLQIIVVCSVFLVPVNVMAQRILIDGIPLEESPLRDSLHKEAMKKFPPLGDTSFFSRQSKPKPDSLWLRYTTSPDSTFTGFWIGDYKSFVAMESSKRGVSMRIDSIKGDSIYGIGVFTSSGGVDLGLLKTPLYLKAIKKGTTIEGIITEHSNAEPFDSRHTTYSFLFNCHKMSSTPDTIWANSDVLEGYAIARRNKEVIPGYFMLRRSHSKEYVPPSYLLPENVHKKGR